MKARCLAMAAVLCAVPWGMAQSVPAALEQHLRAAQQAQAQGDCHSAAREYGAAARLLPESGELRANEGIALYCDDQVDAAVAALQKAASLKATLVAPHLFLGLAWNRLGEYARSARELETAVQLNSTDPRAHLWLGYTYAAEQRFEPAVAQFEQTLRLDTGNTDAEYALGEGELEIGSRAARELARLSPNSPWLLQLEGEQEELSGDSSTAAATLQKAAMRKAQLPVGEASAGTPSAIQEEELYRKAHEAEVRARDAFAAVLQGAPESYRAHEILADSYAARQQQDQALAEYQTVLKLNPGLPGIHQSIAYCMMLEHRFRDALTELRAEQRLQPRSAEVMTELGRVQMDNGDAAGAVASLRAALRLSEPPVEASVLLGKALLRTGDTAGAISNLEFAVKKNPNTPLPYYLLARAYRAGGNTSAMTAAMATFRRLSESSGDEAERRAMERATQGPHAPPPLLSAQDVQDAKTVAAPNP